MAARDVGREPVDYVRNILKYWVAYRLAQEQQQDAAGEPAAGSEERCARPMNSSMRSVRYE